MIWNAPAAAIAIAILLFAYISATIGARPGGCDVATKGVCYLPGGGISLEPPEIWALRTR